MNIEWFIFFLGSNTTLLGLANFYMVGSFAGGAGLPGCAAMGRNLIKKICKQEGITFKTTKS